MLVNLASYNRMVSPIEYNSNDTAWERVLIKLKDPTNKTDIKTVMTSFKQGFTPDQANGITFYNYYDDTDTTEEVT